MSGELPAKIHILDSKGVTLVMSQGRAVQAGSFLLKTLKNSSTQGVNVSFVAPKKVFKTAVARNRAKRRGRALFQALLKEQRVSPGQKLVFVLRPPTIQQDFAVLLDEMKRVLIKNDILQ